VKEKESYICPDLAKEFTKYDTNPEKYFKTYSGKKKNTGGLVVVVVGVGVGKLPKMRKKLPNRETELTQMWH